MITEKQKAGFELGQTVRLIGRAENFVVVNFYLAAGFIPSVWLRNATHQGAARVADIETA